MPVSVSFDSQTPVIVPDEVHESLDAFRAWAGREEMEKAKLCYYRGEVFVEMGGEQVFSHGSVKTEIGRVLANIVKRDGLGHVWINGVLVTHVGADLSCNPDVAFVSLDAFESERMVLPEGRNEGFAELTGTPDMVLEVVSPESVRKDYEVLREGYWEADVPEYWQVDARGDGTPEFQILKRGPRGYVEVRKTAGWMKSAVFGKSFRFTLSANALGQPEYTLHVKSV